MSKKEELLDKAKQYLEQAEEFSAEQAPIVLEEFWAWVIAQNIIGVFISVVAIAFSVFLRVKGYDEDIEENLGPFFNVVFGGIAAVGMVMCVIELLQIWIAPRIYLLENISQLF